jgi:uncharacterized protein
MRRWLLLLFFIFLGTTAHASDLKAIPTLTARVTDQTGTLSSSEKETLEEKLAAFEQNKGSQIAVLLVPTTQPEAIESYSIRVGDQWKLGRKKVDDGVLVLIAKNDHRMRIEVGYGLEGAIPDVTAKRIIDETLTPHFRQGDFYGGLDVATTQLIGLINGETLPAPPKGKGAGLFYPLVILYFIIWIGGFFILPFYLVRRFGPSPWLLGGLHIYSRGIGGGFSIGGSSSGGSRSGSSGGFSGGGGSFGGGGASGGW